MEWIKISDYTYPEKEKRVLLAIYNRRRPIKKYYYVIGYYGWGFFYSDDNEYIKQGAFDIITHWAELPENPEETC